MLMRSWKSLSTNYSHLNGPNWKARPSTKAIVTLLVCPTMRPKSDFRPLGPIAFGYRIDSLKGLMEISVHFNLVCRRWLLLWKRLIWFLGLWLVEMDISTNQRPKNQVKYFQNTFYSFKLCDNGLCLIAVRYKRYRIIKHYKFDLLCYWF